MLSKNGIECVFTGVADENAKRLLDSGLYEMTFAVLERLEHGVEFVEENLLLWAHHVRSRWFELDAVRLYHEKSKQVVAQQRRHGAHLQLR